MTAHAGPKKFHMNPALSQQLKCTFRDKKTEIKG